MAEWRERGFVPDSDEEEEEESIRSTSGGHADQKDGNSVQIDDADKISTAQLHINKPSTTSQSVAEPDQDQTSPQPSPIGTYRHSEIPVPTTAEKLQAELQRGLATCQEVREKQKSFQLPEEDDSPLSSLCSTPAASPAKLPNPRGSSPSVSNTTASVSLAAVPTQEVPPSPGRQSAAPSNNDTNDIPMDMGNSSYTRPSRSFRPRNPVQLNPYSLDYAKYLRDCEQRGLKPLRLPDGSASHPAAGDEETQGSAAFLSSGRAPSPPRPSSPMSFTQSDAEDESQSPVRGSRHVDIRSGLETDDELPDLVDILKGKVPASMPRTQKSRHTKSGVARKNAKPKKPVFRTYGLLAEAQDAEKSEARQSSVYDLPPSPPRSGSASSDQPFVSNDDGDLMLKTTPRPLPTPLLSSDRLPLKRKIIDLSSSSQELDTRNDRSSHESSASDSGEDSQGLMQIRRKIKGVLPASWLKIDARQRERKTLDRQKPHSPIKAAPVKGIAQHIAPTRTVASPRMAHPIALISSSDLEDSSPPAPEGNSPHQAARPAFDLTFSDSDVDMDNVVEEDQVDAMIPSARKPFKSRNSSKKRQGRLDISLQKGAASKPSGNGSVMSYEPSSGRAKKAASKRIKRKHQSAQLTLLDAPGFASVPRDQPRFMRVAARRHVSTRRAVPQNPAKKFFRFASKEDTTEVNADLDAWRSGRLKDRKSLPQPNYAAGPPLAPPYSDAQPHQGERTIRLDYSHTLDQLRMSTALTLSKLENSASSPRASKGSPYYRLCDSTSGRERVAQIFSARSGHHRHDNPMTQGQGHTPPALVKRASFPISKRMLPLRIHAPSTTIKSPSAVEQPVTPRLEVASKSKKRKQKPRLRQPEVTKPNWQDNELALGKIQLSPNSADALSRSTDSQQDQSLAEWVVENMDTTTVLTTCAMVPPSWSGLGHLDETLKKMNLGHRDILVPTNQTTTLKALNMMDELECQEWCDDVCEFIINIIQELTSLVRTSTNQPTSSSRDHLTGRWASGIASMDSLITYASDSLSFASRVEMEAFFTLMTSNLYQIVKHMAQQLSIASSHTHSLALRLFNKIVICVYQITAIGLRFNNQQTTKELIDALWSETLKTIFSLLFSWTTLQRTYLYLQSLWTESSVEEGPAHGNQPAIETLILVQRLLHAHSPVERRSMFSNTLDAFIKTSYENPTSRLAATLLILRVTCPLLKVESHGGDGVTLLLGPTYEAWSLLQPAITAFLGHHASSRGRGRHLQRRLGFIAMQFCRIAVQQWQWPSADGVVKFWFKQYADNNMIELFVVPDLKLLEKRSQRTFTSLDPAMHDTDFDIFLKMTGTLLDDKAKAIGISGNTQKAANRINSLVFSLSPNNSRKLSDDQDLHHEDLASMANTYALYEMLNEFTPTGSQPRFSQIEQLVDFPKCHWSVCQFTLRTWSRFAMNAVERNDHGNIYTLGSWMMRTLGQMVTKFVSTYPAADELEWSSMRYAFNENAIRTRDHILQVLQVWKLVVGQCSTTVECRTLLSEADLDQIILLCKGHPIDDDEVVLMICAIVQAYLDKSSGEEKDGFRSNLHKLFRDVMTSVLSSEKEISSKRIHALTTVWFKLAAITIKHEQKSWEDYLSLPSSWSFRMLGDSELSRQCKVYFLAMIINRDWTDFEGDRESFYCPWIEGLVQPEQNLLFEHELTKSIILHETDVLSLEQLRKTCEDRQGHFHLSLADFRHSRLDIVKHVIRNIYSMQFEDDDSQDLLESLLDVGQGRKLLKLMTDTIKSKWRELPAAERQPYTDFANAIVMQLRIYKYKDFDLDSWFIDPQEPEFPKVLAFTDQFLWSANTPQPVLDERLVRIFTSGNMQAASTPNQESWVEDMIGALSANNTDLIDADGRLAINSELQFRFMRSVLSPLLQNVFTGPKYALFAVPVINALNQVLRDWHFRLDADSEHTMQQMLLAAAELLSAIHVAFSNGRIVQYITKGAIGGLIDNVLELAFACTRRVAMLEPMLEQMEENVQLVETAFGHALAIFERIRDRAFHDEVFAYSEIEEDCDIRETVLEVLDECLFGRQGRGRFVPVWRLGESFATSWDAWAMEQDDQHAETAMAKHETVLGRLEKALVYAGVLDANTFDFAASDEHWSEAIANNI